MIRNTKAEGERGWTLGRNPGAIEQQEQDGQRELVNDCALPIKGLDRLPAEWGIQIVGRRAADPLFVDVKLPPGWRIQATDHVMWSELIDADGQKRAAIFYKAAYYDRNAHISLGPA